MRDSWWFKCSCRILNVVKCLSVMEGPPLAPGDSNVLPRTIYGVGVMTGTSVDGIDVAVVEFARGAWLGSSMRVVAYEEHPYPVALRARVREAMETGSSSLVCQLNVEVGRAIGRSVRATLDGVARGYAVSYVASHGQTLHHVPALDAARRWDTRSTLQVGDASVILHEAGVPVVVHDFRTADMAVGGQVRVLLACQILRSRSRLCRGRHSCRSLIAGLLAAPRRRWRWSMWAASQT